MSCFEIRTGLAAVTNGDSGWFIVDETRRRVVTSPFAAELIGLIHQSLGDEDGLVTGFSEQIDEYMAKAMGISAYVMKPIVRREIANTIRAVLDGN